MTKLEVKANPSAIEALVDKYLSPYYDKQTDVSASSHTSGTKSLETPGVLPAGTYTTSATVYYTPLGGSPQTYTYNATFKIEASGLMSKVAGVIVKILPKSIASKLLSLFG